MRAVSRSVALLLALSALLAPVAAQELQIEGRTFEIGRQLRCPVCVSESVADSSAQIAVQMREQIQDQLEQGRSEAEILAYFQERYGDWILLEPPRRGVHLLVWLLPLAAAATGLTALVVFVRRWTRAAAAEPDIDDTERLRVREAMRSREP